MYVRSLTEDLSDGFFDEMQSKGTTVIELTTDELKVFQDVAKSFVWPQVEEQMGSKLTISWWILCWITRQRNKRG